MAGAARMPRAKHLDRSGCASWQAPQRSAGAMGGEGSFTGRPHCSQEILSPGRHRARYPEHASTGAFQPSGSNLPVELLPADAEALGFALTDEGVVGGGELL